MIRPNVNTNPEIRLYLEAALPLWNGPDLMCSANLLSSKQSHAVLKINNALMLCPDLSATKKTAQYYHHFLDLTLNSVRFLIFNLDRLRLQND